MDLLASIPMMIALYSINLRIMGGPNVPLINDPTLFVLLQPEGMADYVFRPLLLVFVTFNMSFSAFDVSVTAMMKAMGREQLLGLQLLLACPATVNLATLTTVQLKT